MAGPRLLPPRFVTIPAQRRTILAGVPLGGIVRYHDRWAVVESASNFDSRHRILDYWDGPAELVRSNVTVQEVLPRRVEA